MKYIQDVALQQLTAVLTDAAVTGRRVNGRLEAYSMKRAGTDKKLSALLGERYVAEMESLEHYQMMQSQQQQSTTGRKRSQSAGIFEEASSTSSSTSHHHHSKYPKVGGQRGRASSFDGPPPPLYGPFSSTRRTSNTTTTSNTGTHMNTPLGDFSETATRRLMTNLILTLNASFGDYDFFNVKPDDFLSVTTKQAVQRVNERLSELAMVQQQQQNNNNNQNKSLLDDLWTAVDDQISLRDCRVYIYAPSVNTVEDDPFSFLTDSLVNTNYGNDDDESGLSMQDDNNNSDSNRMNTANTTTTTTAAAAAMHTTDNNNNNNNEQTVLWSFNFFFVNRALKRLVFFTCIETVSKEEFVAVSNDNCYTDDVANDVGNDDSEPNTPMTFKWNDAGADSAADDTIDFDLDPSVVAGGVPIQTV